MFDKPLTLVWAACCRCWVIGGCHGAIKGFFFVRVRVKFLTFVGRSRVDLGALWDPPVLFRDNFHGKCRTSPNSPSQSFPNDCILQVHLLARYLYFSWPIVRSSTTRSKWIYAMRMQQRMSMRLVGSARMLWLSGAKP